MGVSPPSDYLRNQWPFSFLPQTPPRAGRGGGPIFPEAQKQKKKKLFILPPVPSSPLGGEKFFFCQKGQFFPTMFLPPKLSFHFDFPYKKTFFNSVSLSFKYLFFYLLYVQTPNKKTILIGPSFPFETNRLFYIRGLSKKKT